MKLFKNLLGAVKPHFEKGGKLEKMYPAYDAFETFLFVPNHTTHKGAHIRDSIDLKRTMFLVIIALIPCMLFSVTWAINITWPLAKQPHCLKTSSLDFGNLYHLLLFPMPLAWQSSLLLPFTGAIRSMRVT